MPLPTFSGIQRRMSFINLWTPIQNGAPISSVLVASYFRLLPSGAVIA